jgi:DNA-binding NarL/FixJ family response regulator
MSQKALRVFVVDDHPIVRFGISAIIDSQPDMEVVGQAEDGAAALRQFEHLIPDVTLMDLKLPDMSGVQVIRTLHQRYPATKFLVLTTYEGDEDIFRALQAGAVGYLIKGMSHDLLVKGIRHIAGGKRYVPSEVAQRLNRRNPQSELSDREQQVLELLAQGKSNKTMARLLGISEATIKCHVSVILAQLSVEDRTQAVLVALQRGLVHI